MWLYVVVFLVLFVLVYFNLKKNTNSLGGFSLKNVLIFGLSNSNKTKLFYRVTEGVTPQTTSSFAVNRKKIQIGEKQIEVIDIPGHASFQQEVMKNLLKGSLLLLMVNTAIKFVKKKFTLRFCLDAL